MFGYHSSLSDIHDQSKRRNIKIGKVLYIIRVNVRWFGHTIEMVFALQLSVHLQKISFAVHYVQWLLPNQQQLTNRVHGVPELLHHDVRSNCVPIQSKTKEHHRKGQRIVCFFVGRNDDILYRYAFSCLAFLSGVYCNSHYYS